jgi:hypothetical protein
MGASGTSSATCGHLSAVRAGTTRSPMSSTAHSATPTGSTTTGPSGVATGHGVPLRRIDFATGESKVFVDGDWIDADEHDS